MKILITETLEVKPLNIALDQQDTLISQYTVNGEFKSISYDDQRLELVGYADYEMAQEDYEWWRDVCDQYDDMHQMVEGYGEKYSGGLIELITENCHSTDFGDIPSNTIRTIEEYFGYGANDSGHKLSNFSFVENANGFIKNEDGSIDASIDFIVHGVIVPTDDTKFEEKTVVVTVKTWRDSDGNFDLNIVDNETNRVDNSAYRHFDNAGALGWMNDYLVEIIENGKTVDGKGVYEICKDMIESKEA